MIQEIYNDIYPVYIQKQKINLSYYFGKIKKIEINTDTFNFYNAVSSMASSKIEGETLEIDSYLKHKLNNVKYIKSLTEKPNDLFSAYEFAQKNKITKTNILKAHKIISKHLLTTYYRGRVRNEDMIIRDSTTGKVVYEACLKENVKKEFNVFFKEVVQILKKDLSLSETFFYASLIHIVFVKIHPFDDGNGRTARLLEKWFLAEKLGQTAWFIQNDLNYWNNRKKFYLHLSEIGFYYESLNYNNAISFLLMLPMALK